jgi:hypothetical protein
MLRMVPSDGYLCLTSIWFGLMGRTREGELSESNAAVLGLLIEKPDTPKGLEGRLKGRFLAAQWAHSTAHSAVKKLEAQGYVRKAEARRRSAFAANSNVAGGESRGRPDVYALLMGAQRQMPPESSRRSQEIDEGEFFEASSPGIEVFWRWLRQEGEPDGLRDELRMKIGFSRPEHSPRMIELLKEEERRYEHQYELLHQSLGPLEDRISDDSYVVAQDWSTLMMIGLLRDEMAIWFAKLKQRERLREYIESLSNEAARRTSSSRPQGH